MKRGDIFGKERNGVRIIKWMDKSQVLMITSVPSHYASLVPTGKTNRKGENTVKHNLITI